MKTGQSTTSFHPATGNPIMTSSTFNHFVDPVMDENKTGYYKELHGATKGLSRVGKPLWIRVCLAINDLLPVSIRPIKSKRARRRSRYPLRIQLFTYRMYWHSHLRNKIKAKLKLK